MPRVTIDNRETTVPEGATLLDAARALGIEVPTLCLCEGLPPNTTCMVCVMKVRNGNGRDGKLVPSCATPAVEGMEAESETEEVHKARRISLELLLSDHAAECSAPCQFADRFGTDIPGMIRAVAEDRLGDAAGLLRRAAPLAGVLARVSRENSEGGCRRLIIDEAVGIGALKRYAADKTFEVAPPCSPDCAAASGKRVAILGAGPAGLSAAYFLQLMGHACTLFEKADEAGGALRAFPEEALPREVLEREIGLVLDTGVILKTGVTAEPALEGFDAVLRATGKDDGAPLPIDKITHESSSPGVFGAGDAVRPQTDPARAASDGKAAAACIDQYLRGEAITGAEKLFALGVGRPSDDEAAALMVDTDPGRRIADGEAGLTDGNAAQEARRCMHCDCRSISSCKLRLYAEQYGASAKRFKGARRQGERITTHPEVIYEPGKCILCGICVQLAEKHGESLGLTHVGRGFDLKIDIPFDETLGKALKAAARDCVEHCPTGALAWKKDEAAH